MNRKGFLKIAEASISIVIIMGVLFIFAGQSRQASSLDLSSEANEILEELAKSHELRSEILQYSSPPNPQIVTDFVSSKINQDYLDFEVKICQTNEVCGKAAYTEGEVFAAERIISSTIYTHSPKRVKIFIWQK